MVCQNLSLYLLIAQLIYPPAIAEGLFGNFKNNFKVNDSNVTNTHSALTNIAKKTPCNELGIMYCDYRGKLTPDLQMKLTHERCPPDPQVKKINWATVNSTNCKQMLELGRLFAVQYECIYRLYKAINIDGKVDPVRGLRYAKAFEPRRTTRFLKIRIAQCIEKYPAPEIGNSTLDEWKARWKAYQNHWTKFSACHLAAELEACSRPRKFSNQCEVVWRDR